MKKAKKMLLAASALALVSFGFGGCSGEEIGDEIINVDGYTAEIDEVNAISTGSKAAYLRNFVPVKYQHTQALCRITMSKPGQSTVKVDSNGNKTEGVGTDTKYASVMGFGFNDKEVNGKSNLYIVGVRMKPGTTDTPQAYVSYFEGVTGDDFNNGSSFGKEYGWNGTSWVEDTSALTTSSDFVDLDKGLCNASGVIDLYVGVMYDEESKKYTVSIISPTVANSITSVDSTAFGAAVTGGQKLLNGVSLKEPDIDSPAKGYIGFYANVAPDANLIGKWNNTARRAAEIAEAE